MALVLCGLSLVLSGCSVTETYYENVDADEITPQTLWRGQEIVLEYVDGRIANIIVAEVTPDHIVAQDGSQWPKTGIERLTLENPEPLPEPIRSQPDNLLDALHCAFIDPDCRF